MVQLWNGWDYASLKETSSSLFSYVILNLSHCYSVGGTALKVTESVRHLKKAVCLSSQTILNLYHCYPLSPRVLSWGPVFLTMYVRPLSNLLAKHWVNQHPFADTHAISRVRWFVTCVVRRWPYAINRMLKFKNSEKATNDWKYKAAAILVTSSCSDKELPSSSQIGSSILPFGKCQKPWCHSRLDILYSSLWNILLI